MTLHKKLRRKLRIWSHLLKKSLMENFIFYADENCWNQGFRLIQIHSVLSYIRGMLSHPVGFISLRYCI